MNYFVYILFSKSKNSYYTRYTQNLDIRLKNHNSGNSRSTKSGIPWILVYSEEFEKKTDALKREREIKRMKSRKYIESLISLVGGRPD